MNYLKQWIKKTVCYDAYRKISQEIGIRHWTREDEKNRRFYSGFVKPGMQCFDIGANIGNRTKVFLKLGAHVVAVEPQDTCMKILVRHYGKNDRVRLVHKALGAREGVQEMMIGSEHTLSSLSENWVESVKKTGRFSDASWNERQRVPVTTMDRLIKTHGVPDFVKIDVEGYEYEVIRGLSVPVNLLSLEFTPEFLDATLQCIDHLSGLGRVQCNWSMNESMEMVLDNWVDSREMIRVLNRHRNDTFFGDVYIRFTS
jgi:FkbM family methyltransferase